MNNRLNITVVVPTYQRSDYLKNCLRSLFQQTRLPEQICVIVRDTDFPTHAAVRDFLDQETQPDHVKIEIVQIMQAGFLPPVQAGINAAQSDIVVFIDDDSEAEPDWLERLEKHYEDPRVGGTGGRVVKFFNRVEAKYKTAKVFGKCFWYGRCEGNLYRDSASAKTISVDGFMGSNMSYRKKVLDKVQLDWTLKNGTAYQYELDLGLQIKALGYRLIYDPLAKVRHYEAAASEFPQRFSRAETIYWMSFNTTYIVFKHNRGWKRWCSLVYEIFIGQSMRWGVLALAWYLFRFKKMPLFFSASCAGRFAGIKAALTARPRAVSAVKIPLPVDLC